MSDFWTRAIGGATTAPPPAPAPVGSGAWWDVPRPTTNAPPQASPVPQTYTIPQQGDEYRPIQAKSARSTAECPDCGSGNIFKPSGQPNAMEQCYHCGWNPRFAHSTAGAGMPSDKSAPVQAAQQISTSNNYHPETLIGHIDSL